MNRQSFRASCGRGGNLIQTRIKSRERYNESSCFSNDLMKRKSFRASRGRGGGGKTKCRRGLRIENYNELSSFSNDLMNRKSFRALRGRGGGEEYFWERYNESSSFSNNLMKRQSFRVSRRRKLTPPPPHYVTPDDHYVPIFGSHNFKFGPPPLRNPGSAPANW